MNNVKRVLCFQASMFLAPYFLLIINSKSLNFYHIDTVNCILYLLIDAHSPIYYMKILFFLFLAKFVNDISC